MATNRLVYWDACVFIKHMAPHAKPDDKTIIEGIDEVVDEAEKGVTLILTSTISRVEVLQCHIPPDGITKYRKLLQRTYIQEFDVDPRIADAAHDITAHYMKVGHTLNAADAIHIATACLRGAHQMFTLDGTSKKKPGLISLSGKVANKWDLEICAPRAMLGRLFPIRASLPAPTEPAPAASPKEEPDDKKAGND